MLHINVNEHTEKKNGVSYLSWAWAWAECLKVDPLATWGVVTYGHGAEEKPFMSIGKTAMVHTWVSIKGLRRDCMLPVMDHRNKAIPEPDAFAVNTAIMRCMTKAISMHGLGLYIYAGEDLPQVDDPQVIAQREKQRFDWIASQVEAVRNAKTAGELKRIVAEAKRVTDEENDADAFAHIEAAAAEKVAKAKEAHDAPATA